MSTWGTLAGLGMLGGGVVTMNPTLALGGAGVLAGEENNKYKRQQEQSNMLANAEALRYSPWTHMNPGMMKAGVGSDLMAGMQGGLAGAMMGSQFATPEKPAVATGDTRGEVEKTLNSLDSKYGEAVPLGAQPTAPIEVQPPQPTWSEMNPFGGQMPASNPKPNFYSRRSPWVSA